MNPLIRVGILLRRSLQWVDSFAIPPDPSWGIASRVWTDPRWSFFCLLFLLGILLHPLDGIPFRLCLFNLMFGVDCPGCGMTRALSQLTHGHGVTALRLHPFSPLVLLYLIVQAVSPFLPLGIRVRVADGLTRHQTRLEILFWVLVGLFFLYGLGRAMVQFMAQSISLGHPETPSFRMGW